MTDDLWFAVAIIAFLVAGVWALNRLPSAAADEADDQAEWDRTAEDAARAVADHVAEARRQREIANLEAAYKIRSPRRNTIPPQRQPRKDQP